MKATHIKQDFLALVWLLSIGGAVVAADRIADSAPAVYVVFSFFCAVISFFCLWGFAQLEKKQPPPPTDYEFPELHNENK